jgi:hypothetical protein
MADPEGYPAPNSLAAAATLVHATEGKGQVIALRAQRPQIQPVASIRQFGIGVRIEFQIPSALLPRPMPVIEVGMIRDLSHSDDRRLTANCRICVIGGGVAGLIAASRLSASGHRVIVLESGDRKPLGRYDAFNSIEQAGETYANAVTGRTRALGGTSTTWGGRIMPLAPYDMEPRDYLGLSAWPIDRADLDQFTSEIERLFRLDQSPYEELLLPPPHRFEPLPGDSPDMTPRWSK